MNELVSARQLKAIFIDYLFPHLDKEDVVGSEIMFGSKKGVADLILFSNGQTFAYEIKAQNDDFRKLRGQLEEYNKTFDFVSLITTEKHSSKANRIVPKNNGIIIIYNDLTIKNIREPNQNIFLNKDDLLSTMTIKYIEKRFKLSRKKLLAQEFRNSLKYLTLDELRESRYEFLYQRIRPKFVNFIIDKGTKTHSEDITLLSETNKKIKI
jgi:hypothetical protein